MPVTVRLCLQFVFSLCVPFVLLTGISPVVGQPVPAAELRPYPEWADTIATFVESLATRNAEGLEDTLDWDEDESITVETECITCWRHPFFREEAVLRTDETAERWIVHHFGEQAHPVPFEASALNGCEGLCCQFEQVDPSRLEFSRGVALRSVCFEYDRSYARIDDIEMVRWEPAPTRELPCRGAEDDEAYIIADLSFSTEPYYGFPAQVLEWPDGDGILVAGTERPGRFAGTDVIWRIACDGSEPPAEFLVRDGADFAHSVLTWDSDRIFFTSRIGVIEYHFEAELERVFTVPPMYTWHDCASNDEFTLGWDFVTRLSHDQTVIEFLRGVPCGYEGEWDLTSLWLPLDPDGVPSGMPFAPFGVFDVTVDATGVVWVAADRLYRSNDSGDTFQAIEIEDPDSDVEHYEYEVPVSSVAVHPSRPGNVVVVFAQGFNPGIGDIGGWAFRSEDDGATWHVIEPPDHRGSVLDVLGIVDGSPLSLIAWDVRAHGDVEVYRSSDGGESWTEEPEIYPHPSSPGGGQDLPSGPFVINVESTYPVDQLPQRRLSTTGPTYDFRTSANGLFRRELGTTQWVRILPDNLRRDVSD